MKKSVTSFRNPLEVGLNLALTLRHLATGETYTFWQYHWLLGRTIVYKFLPQGLPIQEEYVCYPIISEDWKSWSRRPEPDRMSPCSWALDGKHIPRKEPKKSGSEYNNYKGFFSLVLLALVHADYRFFWVNVESSGSSSDAQIFNCSKARKNIEDDTFCHLNPWGKRTRFALFLPG